MRAQGRAALMAVAGIKLQALQQPRRPCDDGEQSANSSHHRVFRCAVLLRHRSKHYQTGVGEEERVERVRRPVGGWQGAYLQQPEEALADITKELPRESVLLASLQDILPCSPRPPPPIPRQITCMPSHAFRKVRRLLATSSGNHDAGVPVLWQWNRAARRPGRGPWRDASREQHPGHSCEGGEGPAQGAAGRGSLTCPPMPPLSSISRKVCMRSVTVAATWL